MKNFKLIIFFLFLQLSFISCQKENRPIAENGILDLTGWNFQKNGLIELNGEWEFYPNKLLNSEDFTNLTESKNFINVPETWTKCELKNKLTNKAFATYRLIVLLKPKVQKLNIVTDAIYTVSKVIINDSIVGGNGLITNDFSKIEPKHAVKIQDFNCGISDDTLEIIIQVANNNFMDRSGLVYPLKLGSSNKIFSYKINHIAIRFLIIGSFIFMMLYQIALFFYTGNRTTLYISLLALCFSIFFLFRQDIASINYFFNLDYSLGLIFRRASVYFAILFLTIYLFELFPQDYKRFFLYFAIGFSIVNILIVSLFSEKFISIIMPYSRIGIMICSLFLILVSIIAFTKKRDSSSIFLISLMPFLIASFNDILCDFGLITTTTLTPYGLFIFMIVQSFILSYRYIDTAKQNIILTEKLKHINENLEAIVVERTEEIEQQKEEIKIQRDRIFRQNREMLQSIHYAERIQKAVLPDYSIFDSYFSQHFVYLNPKNIVSGDFYWLKQIKFEEQNILIFAAADCTGHGIPGAFLSILSISLLNEVTKYLDEFDASQILEDLRKNIIISLGQNKNTDNKDGLDIALCIYFPEFKKINFAGAYNSVILVRNAKIIEYKGTRAPVGIHFYERDFKSTEFEVQNNDSLYIYTDGFVDQLGGKEDKKFFNYHFKKLLLTFENMSMEQQKIELQDIHAEWKGLNKQVDDILVIGIKF